MDTQPTSSPRNPAAAGVDAPGTAAERAGIVDQQAAALEEIEQGEEDEGDPTPGA
jgi:hypothetical protein